MGFELRGKLVSMRALHHENQVGPVEQFGRDRILRIVIQARRGNLDARPVQKHLFCRRTTQAILAADEEYVSQERFSAIEYQQAATRCH